MNKDTINNKITTKMNVKDNLINVIRVNKIDYISLTDLARYIAELREKYVEETASVRQMGKEEGIKEGKEEAIKEVAKMMKEKNYAIDEIVKITKLKKEDIEKI